MVRYNIDRIKGAVKLVNAYFKSKNNIERQISNLAHSPFIFEGRSCLSFEGFYQGIKRSGDDIQNHIFMTFGMNAKKKSKPTRYVYYNGKTMLAGSDEHHELLYLVQRAKYFQNKESRDALLATGDSSITHNVGRDSAVYPAKVYCRHLVRVRAELKEFISRGGVF